MKWRLIWILMTTMLISWMVHPAGAADPVRNVLVLHAYHQGLAWTDAVTQGIDSVFNPFSTQIELHIDYLDAKRHGGNDYQEQLALLYRDKLAQRHFDALIVADDEAYAFIRRPGVLPQPTPAVVFCGVSRFVPEMLSTAQPTTGVVEQYDHQATLQLMLALHPDCARIVVLLDAAPTGLEICNELEQVLPAIQNQVTVEIWKDEPLDDLPARLQGLGFNDLIYVLALNRDKHKPYLFSDEGIRIVARWSPVASYSCLEAYLGKGIVGGRITSGFSQGEQAAQIALRLISGESASAIGVMQNSPNRYAFDDRQLQRFGLKTADLPTGSLVLHQPLGFWVRHSRWVLFFALGMGLSVLGLLGYVMRQIKQQHYLVRIKADLDDRINEKSAQLRMIYQKLKKQSLTDGVTGMANRRYILQQYAVEIKKARRYTTPLAIVMLDIDRFKQINDEFGHVIGDKVLREVGQAIKRTVRDIDLVGRYSAEVFMVILPNTDSLKGYTSAERIRAIVAALQLEQGQVRVTISGGLAELKAHSPSELTKIAETQLAIAKSRGGDQIVSPTPHPLSDENRSVG